jgi:hypothetical protein
MLEVDIYSKILEFMEIVVILKHKKLLQKSWKYANVHGLVVGCELVKQMAEIEKRLSIMTTLRYKQCFLVLLAIRCRAPAYLTKMLTAVANIPLRASL